MITELKEKNAELEQFTYTVSHDLKAPPITIQGFLGFPEQDLQASDMERIRSDLSRITDATNKMQKLIIELLDLSRVGRIKNPSKDIPFGIIVKDALEVVRGRLRRLVSMLMSAKKGEKDGEPIFYVRDNGIGIDPQHLERVFGLFNKLNPQSEGTGVGLALVNRIVEVHNGRIWIESDGGGRGTPFCFTLPAASNS